MAHVGDNEMYELSNRNESQAHYHQNYRFTDCTNSNIHIGLGWDRLPVFFSHKGVLCFPVLSVFLNTRPPEGLKNIRYFCITFGAMVRWR